MISGLFLSAEHFENMASLCLEDTGSVQVLGTF